MNDAVAEPVVYMIDRYVVGGFYRVHAERGIDENLAAPRLALRAAGLRAQRAAAAPAVKSPAPAHQTASTCTASSAGWQWSRPATSWKTYRPEAEVYA